MKGKPAVPHLIIPEISFHVTWRNHDTATRRDANCCKIQHKQEHSTDEVDVPRIIRGTGSERSYHRFRCYQHSMTGCFR